MVKSKLNMSEEVSAGGSLCIEGAGGPCMKRGVRGGSGLGLGDGFPA